MSDLVKFGALWAGKKDKNGNPMLTGKIGDARVLIFKNSYKDQESHPDYIIYVTSPDKDNAPPEKSGTGEGGDMPF